MTDDGAVRHRGLEQQRGRRHRIDCGFLVAEAGRGHRSRFERGHQPAQFRRIDQPAAVAPRLLRDDAATQRLGPLRLAVPLHRATPLHDQARRTELALQPPPAGHAEVIQFVIAARPLRAGVDPGKRVRRGARGRAALLEQVDFRAALGEVIRDRRTHDAAADDDDAPRRPRRQPRWPNGQGRGGEAHRTGRTRVGSSAWRGTHILTDAACNRSTGNILTSNVHTASLSTPVPGHRNRTPRRELCAGLGRGVPARRHRRCAALRGGRGGAGSRRGAGRLVCGHPRQPLSPRVDRHPRTAGAERLALHQLRARAARAGQRHVGLCRHQRRGPGRGTDRRGTGRRHRPRQRAVDLAQSGAGKRRQGGHHLGQSRSSAIRSRCRSKPRSRS